MDFNTGEEVHTTEAQGVGRNQGYVHLQKGKQKRGERHNEKKWQREGKKIDFITQVTLQCAALYDSFTLLSSKKVPVSI